MSAALLPGTGVGFSIGFGDGAVVAVTGELDIAATPDLAAVLDALIDRGHPSLTIDASELRFIDASGLGVLAAAHARLAGAGGEIRVRGASPMAYRLFEITELTDVLHVECVDPNERREPNDTRQGDPVAWQASRLAADSARADALADVLSRLAVLIPEIITACDGVSVTLRRPDYFMTAAASDDRARELDNIQYAVRQGPCLDAATTGAQTHAPLLADEQRWQSFTPHARERGIESILSSPLIVNDELAGALNLYSSTPESFEPIHQGVASLFAAQAALLLHEPDDPATSHEFDERVHDALASRDVIAQAQGILMERLDVDANAAFVTLRRDSVRTSVPLRVQAGDIVAETQERSTPTPPNGPAND